ncbi:ubiquitin-conjugating enzyme/RWD-like protein [Butyriboletus roseoflavus]|nr:ubiquitin-conjugating enzyme/RWD-like protein [Butyriboletus roseoflavus]
MPPASSSSASLRHSPASRLTVFQMTMKRIHREIADAQKEDLGAITLAPTQDSLYRWKATIPGPQGSPYEGGVYNVDIQLAHDYPFSAPKVTFATRIYHMNVSDKGGICIDILKQNWSPALSLFKVMLSLSSLLTDPNPHDPLVPSIATEYTRNRAQHDRTARRWTELYARPPSPPPQLASALTSVPGSSSKRTKGKEKASTTQTAPPSRSGGAAAGTSGSSNIRRQLQSEPIMIDDMGEEVPTPASAPPRQSGRKRRREPDIIDVDLGEEERIRSRLRVPPGYSSSRVQSSGEVIVIDD